MQGQLRNQPLSATITTVCDHCQRPLRLTVGSDLQMQVDEQRAQPLAFFPDVDWDTFSDPTIIDAY